MEVSKELFNKKMGTMDWAFISSFINMVDIYCLTGCERVAIPVSVSEDTNYELDDLKELVEKYRNNKSELTEEEFILKVRQNIHWLLDRISGQLEI